MNLKKDDCVKLGIIKDTLDNDYKRHYTYSQLAQKVNTNEFKLKNGFLQLYKISLYAYLTNVRIEKAKDLLGDSRIPVKRVAAIVGIRNDANFIRCFKRLTGQSPKEWRRCNCVRISNTCMGENKVLN